MADEKSENLAWLSPLEPQICYQDIRTRRAGEVGDWLLLYKLRNIGIGLVVSAAVNLMIEPCFAKGSGGWQDLQHIR